MTHDSLLEEFTMAAASPPARRMPRWAWFLIAPLALILLFLIVLLLLPVERDTPIAEADWGVGADNVDPSETGLLREWPTLDQPYSDELASLGYQLFFDPVLS